MTAPFPNPHFAISLYCSDFRNPAPQVEYLNTVADSYHVDIMDGHFSPQHGPMHVLDRADAAAEHATQRGAHDGY